MQKQYYIYKYQNMTNGSCYVGSSAAMTTRAHHHVYYLRKNKHHSFKLQKAFNKYGENSFKFYILTIEPFVDRKSMYEKEQYFLDLLKPRYNVNLIAGGGKNWKATHEQKKGYAIRSKERMKDEKNRVILSVARSKNRIFEYNKHTLEVLKIHKNRHECSVYHNWTRKKTNSVIDSLSGVCGSILLRKEGLFPKKNQTNIAVIKYDLLMNEIGRYNSISDAALELMVDKSSIRKKINSNIPIKGFYFKAAEIKKSTRTRLFGKSNPSARQVIQLDKEYNYISSFDTIQDAIALNFSRHISSVCSGKRHFCGGFRWMYKEDYEKWQSQAHNR